MARAEVASASVSSDSIKGLAQSIAKPAYRRLLTAEPALRRAVPALIIAFLLTICVGAIVQVLDHRRQAISDIIKQIEGSADFLVDRLERLEQPKAGSERRLQSELERVMPSGARAPGRQVLIANGDGVIVAGIRHEVVTSADGTISATAPLEAGMIGRRLLDVLGPTQPLTTFGAAAGVLEIPLADGSPAYGTVRSLYGSNGELAIIHGRAEALAPWASDTALTVTLSATTGFVVLILGFAFHWQATRAREADLI
ncbi:MAG TPA: PAS domain-containing sensor histidine kinase, partial [Xanthobacteraceae bacterium]|nr:PAS domain-containing sensor histidine kinase [Xanthobacteraceae bacterium]